MTTQLEEQTTSVIGAPIKRVEDPVFITGEAKYMDDLKLPGMAHVAVLRSPYAHARIKSIDKQVAEQGIVVPPLGEVDLSPLRAGEELAIIKRLVQYPEVVKGAAHALEPHRLAYWLQELAGGFHPYYKTHRVIQDDRRLMHARLALCAGVGRVIRNGLELLGVSAPESM